MADDPPHPAPDRRPDTARRPTGPAHAGGRRFLTMGVSMALCLVLGGGIGYAVDRSEGTSPLWTLVGLAFGVSVAVLFVVAP